MDWSDLEKEIERWTIAANVALRILFPSERRLCERVFSGYPSASDLSFMEVCIGSAIQLLNFADAFAISSRSPERLFKVLDVYETLGSWQLFDLPLASLLCGVITEMDTFRSFELEIEPFPGGDEAVKNSEYKSDSLYGLVGDINTEKMR